MKAKKDDITHKLKIARGQIDGILQMIEEDRYCVDISTQLQSVQALLKSVNQQILQAHIRNEIRSGKARIPFRSWYYRAIFSSSFRASSSFGLDCKSCN